MDTDSSVMPLPIVERPPADMLRGRQVVWTDDRSRELKALPDNALWHAKSLGFRLIDACNLHCHMCGQAAQRQERVDLKLVKKRPFLELEALQRIIDSIVPYGLQVYLWGGEPLIYPYLLPFLEHIADRGLGTFITTNGYYLDRFIEPIVDLRVVEVCVSIDGLAEVHDRIRGKEGTFDRALRNLEMLADYKKQAKKVLPIVDIHFVVLPDNYKDLVEFVEAINAARVARRIRIQLPMYFTDAMSDRYREHVGNVFKDLGEESWNRFRGEFTGMDLNHLARSWDLIRSKYRNVILLPNISGEQAARWFRHPEEPFKTRPDPESDRQRCETCLVRINIEPNGDVVACTDFPESIVGNVLRTPIEEIYNGPIMQAHRRVARSKNGASCGICARCSYLYVY